MSMNVLTEKEKKRMAKVNAMLDAGLNPYSTLENGVKDQGGLDQDRQERLRLHQTEMSEARTKELETKWKSRSRDGAQKAYTIYKHSPAFNKNFGVEIDDLETIVDPEKVICSFCRTEIDRVNASHGAGKPQKHITLSVITDPITDLHTIEEKVSHSVKKLVACPKCVLKLGTTLRFPETDG